MRANRVLGSLYCGADLEQAAVCSDAGRSPPGALASARNAVGVIGEIVRERLAGRRERTFEVVTASGLVPNAESKLTAIYAGTGANRAWCLSSVFAEYDEMDRRRMTSSRQMSNALRAAADGADIVFTDGVGERASAATGRDFVCMPAWIKQRVPVQAEWTSQLAALRRGTRQETARIFRKYGYECRLSRDPADAAHFYECLYRPHIARRFGPSALAVERERFVRECGRGVVLQLHEAGAVRAAALLRRLGNTLAIVWSATDPEAVAGGLRGLTDAMDYCSLLYANLTGCRWLDFGPSRPDLYDGALRYKRKWGAGITAGFVRQATIRWTCMGRHAGEREFLSRHAFLSRGRNGLRAVIFIDGGIDADALAARINGLMTPGVAEYRVVALSRAVPPGLRAVARDLGPRVTLARAESVADAMAAAVR